MNNNMFNTDHLKHYLSKSIFAKNVILISGGTAFAQVVSILFSPIITRLYSPEDYGILTLYIAIIGIIGIIGTLSYDLGIPIAETDDIAVNLLALSTIILVFFSLFLTLLLFFWSGWFLNLFDGKYLSIYRYFIPIGFFFGGLYLIFSRWSLRKKYFKDIYNTKINQSITNSITKVILGVINTGPIGLIIGQIFGQSAGINILAKSLFRHQFELIKKIKLRKIYELAKKYKYFPLFSTPSQILNSVGVQVPILFITSLFGSEVVGLFGLASGIVRMPMNLIGGSVGDVFFAEAASVGKCNPERIRYLSRKLLKKLILIGIIPFLTLLFFGPVLFKMIFGNNWAVAGIYAQIISFMVYVRFITDPITRVFTVFERQKDAFYLNVIRVVLIITVFISASYFNLNSYYTVGIYCITMTIVYLLTFIFAQRIINNAIKIKDGI